MKNIKRVLSVVMMLAMLVPLMVVGSYADAAVEDNWYTFGAKYSSSTDKIIAPSNVVKTEGFEFTVNDEGGIDVTVPGTDVFKGINPVAAISSKNTTFLDGLKVEIDPFADTNDGKIASRFSVIWSDVEVPVICDPVAETGLCWGNAVSTNSLRHIVEGLSASGLCITVGTNGVDTGNSVAIVLYSGNFNDACDSRPGYRWVFSARNHPDTSNGDYSPISRGNEKIDLTNGIEIHIRPDSTLGFVAQVNGKDYYKGLDIGYFPNNNRGHGPTGGFVDEDYLTPTKEYLESMTYAREDIDLSDLVAFADGYIVVGAAGGSLDDPNMDFTVKSINGTPAALWDGHSHTWEGFDEYVDPDCVTAGYATRTCAECGAVETYPLSPLGHTWGEKFDEVESTCAAEGSYSHTCTVCGVTETETVATLAHTYADNWAVTREPNYYSWGVEARYCTVCLGAPQQRLTTRLENPFIDVAADKWYTEPILYCFEKGYMTGVSEDTFDYKGTMDRQMFATILAKIDGADTSSYTEMSFSDVKAGQWYSNAIEWAYQNEYAAGVGEGIYGRKNPVTREQMAMFFYTYSEKNGINVTGRTDITGFADYNRVHEYALEALSWAVNVGIISGTSDTTLSPRDSATRAQVAVIVMSYVENVKNAVVEEPETPDEPETPELPETPDEPETPEVPETPEEPETPEVPETPEEPETPEVPETPAE